jgi:peptide/nickel transport system ATP-binding protein
MDEKTLLQVNGLKKFFGIRKGLLRQVHGYVKAVDDVSFAIRQRETLGLVGESGCGKSTLGKIILRAIEPTEGQIFFQDNDKLVDVLSLDEAGLRLLRQNMQMIFQDPYSSLNPRMTVRDIVGESLLVNEGIRGRELDERVAALLRQVGLRTEYMRRYPHAFSGGQRQRIGIARALALGPRFIICDEAVSALDVSIQAQILNLLEDLQQELHLTYLFIAHDLGVVKHISDRVAVMYVGKLLELAGVDQLFSRPLNPYSEALLSAVPKPDPEIKSNRIILKGEVADSSNPPEGCYFHPRCNYAQDLCKNEVPQMRNLGSPEDPHLVRCHYAEKIDLQGIIRD